MTNKKHSYGQSKKSESGTPASGVTDQQEQKNQTAGRADKQLNPSKWWVVKKWQSLGTAEAIMVVLTFAGVVIAGLTGGIFWLQLHEMRTDQRAWISVATVVAQYPQAANSGALVVAATVNNVGKTAARHVFSGLVLDYVVNGGSPDFVYEGRVRTQDSTGSIFPNSPHQAVVPFQHEDKNHNLVARQLTEAEFNDLSNGNAYMAVYAHTEYVDIFGTPHWLHFCTFFVAPNVNVNVTAKGCTDYNDTDSN